MALKITTHDSIRDVEYARSYDWSVWFPGVTWAPFLGWFPAQSVTEPIVDIQSHSFEIGCYEYKIPLKQGANTLSITFLDDSDHSLEAWMEEWIWKIFPPDRSGVKTLEGAIQKCHVMKLTPAKKPLHNRMYDVYPEGPIVNEYNSEPTVKTFTVSFVVVGLVI